MPGVSVMNLYGTEDLAVKQDTITYVHLNMNISQNQLHQQIALSFQSSEMTSITDCNDGYIQVIGIFDDNFNTNLTGMFTSFI